MFHSSSPRPYIVVEGNIGAGKSTFLAMIRSYLNAQIVFEPHDLWQNVGGENLLDQFYKDTGRWSYTFQSYAFLTRVRTQREHALRATEPIQVLERSIYSDRYCFAKTCHELGLMSSLEWKLYNEWFAWLSEIATDQPSGFIYLRTDPDIAFNRVHKRHRSEEVGVTHDYLSLLHQRHEDWLIHKRGVDTSIAHVPVLILESNEDFQDNNLEQKKHIRAIVEFLDREFNVPPHMSVLPTVTL